MSQYNLRYVPTLSTDLFILNGQRFNTQAAAILANGNIINTPALSTEVIINDATKNQALFAGLVELQGEVIGNVNPNLVVVDSRLTALEGNVAILQGNVIFLQNEINDISSNISGLNANTQYLHAPYNGLAGNTSYFTNGLQVWNGADENGNGIFSYVDGGAPADQISLKVENGKNILLNGGSTNISPQSVGNVSINNADGNFNFLVGNRTLPNFQNISKTEINGRIDLKGETNTAISIYTQPAQVVPIPISAIKRCDVRGDDETRLFGGAISATGDSGGKLEIAKSVRLFTPGGSAPGVIDLQVGSCDVNTTGKINIGTEQGLTELGFKEIYIGQSGPPSAARKSSTLIDGDLYLPQNLILQQNLGGWDNMVYLGLPTAYSGALRGPVKNTYSPYVKSISTFSAAPTINSFISSSGTFSVAVGLGAITLNAGAGGILTNCAGGLISLTSLVGGIGLTTAGGGIALTTGAGIIQMTTGAGPIAMETNYGDILLKAGYSNQSTPELSIGSVYLQARNYTYITPDEGVIVGEGIVTPFNDTLLNTMNYPFSGNLFSNAFISNLTGVFSNTFITPNSTTTLLNPITSNLIYSNLQYETGSAYALLRNMDINGTIATSSLATVPSGNLGANVAITNTTTNFFFPDNTVLPLNANVKVFVYIPDTPNISHYGYSTWQSNANIASNISGLVNGYVQPLPPVYDNYMTVLGNVGILSDLDVGANITVASSSFPLQQTVIKRNSIITTGDITCSTLNYSFLNPPISGNVAGVSQIIAGNGIEISPLIGTGNVTVSLAGSVIPPGGYLPIAGGTMTGPIYQYPQGNLNYNTVKKYRPLSSYQPPFPSIGPPTFTGEMLTFYNGDNSPEQINFTGWFPQSLVSVEPDVMTQLISGTVSNVYSLSNTGTPSPYDNTSCTAYPTFTNGVHITGGTVYISQIETTKPLTLTFGYPDGTPFYSTTYQPGSFPSTGLFTYTLDYTHTLTTGQYTAYWDNTNSNFSMMVANPLIKTNWCGTLSTTASSFYLMAFNDGGLSSVIYKWFPEQSIVEKQFSLDGTLYGISEQMIGSRNLYFYGLFDNYTTLSSTRVNNIFIYNVDSAAVITLQADTALVLNPPIGTNDAVYGVEVDTVNDRTWLWGDFTYVGTNSGGVPPGPLNDVELICGCDFTTTSDWSVPVQWEGINGYANVKSGKLLNDANDAYSLIVWAEESTDGNNPPSFLPFNNIGMNYFNTVTNNWTIAAANPMQGGSITQPVSKIQVIGNYMFFLGSYNNAIAFPTSNVCRSITYTLALAGVDQTVGAYYSEVREAYNSSNTGFWVDNGIQINVSNVRLMSNNLLVMNTNGYGTLNGGGVMTQILTSVNSLPTQWPITGIPRYSTNFIGGNDPEKILLTCSLNRNNFFYSQTLNSEVVPPTPTDPTVNAINGAKFLVDNTEMDKIVFAGSNQDYSSVSFIAGIVEDNDYNWYWQSQVGALDYYAGATFYPNITSSPASLPGPTTDTWGNVLINGNVASKGIDMNNFNIINANTITPIAGNDLNVVVSGAGSLHITQSSTGGASQPILELENTNGGANGGHMDFYKNSASPALDDVIGAISLHANNASATKVEYARISATQRQTTAGSENGSVSVFCCSNSPTPTEMIRFNGDGQTGTGSIDTYKPFNISTNTIIGSSGSINLVNGLFTSILTSTNLRVQDTTTTTTQTQLTKSALTVATLGINTVYGLASIITTGSTNFAITNTSFSLNLTGSGMLLNSGANLIQITQPLNGVTKLSTDRPGHKFYPDYVIDNSGQNTVTVPAPEIINQRLTIVNYGLTQNNVWASYGDSYGNGVNFIFRDSNSRVWVANDAGLITIRDDTLNTPDLQTIQVGGGTTQIYIIYESAGYVYIGGDFSNVDGNPQLQYSISRFDISSFPYSFSPMFGGFQYREGVQGSVFAISDIGAGNLIIGGNFTLFSDSNPCNYICIISSAQSAPSSQTFTEYAGGTNGTIQALLYDSSYNYLWVGGAFTSVQGGAFVRNYCSAYGVINLTWDEVAGNSLNSNVNCITLTSFGQIFLAGDFPALPSGQNYSTYIDRSNPAVYNDTNLGGVPNFSQRNLAFYDGNFGVLNAGGVWVNTSQLVWVFIENPTSAAVPASGIPLCITIWSGNWKVGYSTTSKVYAHTLLPDSCNFNGNYKYGVGVHTTATLTNENTSQQFIGDPTCSFWIPIGTPINSFS